MNVAWSLFCHALRYSYRRKVHTMQCDLTQSKLKGGSQLNMDSYGNQNNIK